MKHLAVLAARDLWAGLLLVVCVAAYAQEKTEPAPEEQAPLTLQDIEQRLLRVEQIAGSRGIMQLSLQFDQVRNEIRALRSSLEETAYQLERLQARQEQLFMDLDQRLRVLEYAQPLVGEYGDGQLPPRPPALSAIPELPEAELAPPPQFYPPTEPPLADPLAPVSTTPEPGDEEVLRDLVQPPALPRVVDAASPSTPVATTVPVAPVDDPVLAKASYDQAFRLLKQSLYESAISAFEAFLEEFPQSEHTGNARYWLAEAYYISEDYERALAEYHLIVEQHPQSLKLAQAILKIGYTYQAMGNEPKAREALQRVIGDFPASPEASLARRRLEELGA